MKRESCMIEVKNLTVRIGEKRILREVNLRIAKGEAVVLFGPNGCGKTSLLKAIMGGAEYRVESWKILFAGKDITGLPMDERGFLDIEMKGVPESIGDEIKRALRAEKIAGGF